MLLKSKKILVTGAGGFVGSHLVERLVRLGSTVRCFVRYNSRDDAGLLYDLPLEIQKDLEIMAGDLRDADAVFDALQGIHCVFHLGALIAIPYSYIHPREVIETNVLGTLNVMQAARRNNIEKVVHTSTSEVYGSARYVPIDEHHPLQGQSPYSASKIGADKIAESFYASYELPVATIRPFNTYGPRQSARAVIPTIITQALTGTEIRLGATFPTRDLTYVEDTVDAFIKIAQSDTAIGGVFNVGSGHEISIGDLALKIISLIGRKLSIVIEDRRLRPQKSEVHRLLADNSQARITFGWGPSTSLDAGLLKTIEWVRAHLARFKTGDYII